MINKLCASLRDLRSNFKCDAKMFVFCLSFGWPELHSTCPDRKLIGRVIKMRTN